MYISKCVFLCKVRCVLCIAINNCFWCQCVCVCVTRCVLFTNTGGVGDSVGRGWKGGQNPVQNNKNL